MTICQFCKAIPFVDLPSEDEPALPHQPSLGALKASAGSCTLCHLILRAAIEVRKEIDNTHKGLKAHAWNELYSQNTTSSGQRMMEHSVLGRHGSGSVSNIYSEEETLTSGKPGYPFRDDASIRPWLFGNWWKACSGPLQLMGLGVRLAATPNVEDAEGNGDENRFEDGRAYINIRYYGSYLRIRMEDGRRTLQFWHNVLRNSERYPISKHNTRQTAGSLGFFRFRLPENQEEDAVVR